MRMLKKNKNYIYTILLFILFLSITPALPDYYIIVLGKYLSLAIVAIGISWIWGHMNILSLGQGLFFGLGSYAMAIHLKLKATPSGDLPDFMLWSGLTTLPLWWQPFNNIAFAFMAIFLIPTLLAAVFSYIMFKREIAGVYFALISQAAVAIFEIFLISLQPYTGGFNGITNFGPFFFWYVGDNSFQRGLLFITEFILFSLILLSFIVESSNIGKLIRAIRDNENRLKFFGYNTIYFKIMVFTISGTLAGIGGALFTLFNGSISPSLVGVLPSIEMILWVALVGRQNFLAVVLSVIGINLIKDQISSYFPNFWLYFIGIAYIIIILASNNVNEWKNLLIRLMKAYIWG